MEIQVQENIENYNNNHMICILVVLKTYLYC